MVAANRLMTTAELAETLSVTPATVRAWARDGIVPSIRPTRRTVRFDLEAVSRRLAEREAAHTRRPADQAHQPEHLAQKTVAGPS